MKLSDKLFRAATLATCVAGLAASASAEPKNFGPLAWMVGCWQSADGANVENWSAPLGGVMFGYATTIKDGQLAFFEQARIDLRHDRFAYSVSPDGDRWVTFVSPPVGPPELDKRGKPLPAPAAISFENSENTFPQRIEYHSAGKKSLAATISKLDGSQPTAYTWDKCRD
ncbi:MAG: DUF6265 family protein [Alphaproteobacteria bacterium]